MDSSTSIPFEQLPKAVGEILNKIDILISLVSSQQSSAKQEDAHIPLSMDEASRLLGKAASTIYALTSQKRIPYHKQGNKLYFFKDELLQWIETGCVPLPESSSTTVSENCFEEHLKMLRASKCRHPSHVG